VTAALAVGIDVGATKLAAALVDLDAGRAAGPIAVRPTRPDRGGDAVLADCAGLARDVAGGRRIAAVGLGVPEVVDPEGAIRTTETVDWRTADLAAAFDGLGPVHVESDVRAAAIAEARHGPARDFLYLSVGSGISHCLVADGRPRAGARGSAINTGAPLVERWAGGIALARRSGHDRAEDALADPAAAAIVEEGAVRLGEVLAVLVNALDPGAVVFGGGLGLAAPYRDRVAAVMRAGLYDDAVRDLPVRAAFLGAEGGVTGAALAAAQRGSVASIA
jgi:predicted NBD/HSP70 family sugar kinase